MNSSFTIEDVKEYDQHRYVACFYDHETDTRSFIALHRGGLVNPCFGATRIWPFASEEEGLNDALRLSRMMSYKNALAGTKYGGGKGVIVSDVKSGVRKKQIIQNYAKFVDTLSGHFITGADVGVSENDVKIMKQQSKHIVGVKQDPVYFTAQGLFAGLKAALKEVFGTSDHEGRTFAIQGLGKTGAALFDLVYKKAEHIYVADINPSLVDRFAKFKKVTPVSPDSIHSRRVDVFSPCALSGILNDKTVRDLKCKIILGSANNQLASPEIGLEIHKKSILYSPDYVVNAGGLISVVDEYENSRSSKSRVLERVNGIERRLAKIIRDSKSKGMAMSKTSDMVAEKIIQQYK